MSVGAHINDTIRWRWGVTPLLGLDGKLQLLIPASAANRASKRTEVLDYLAHDGNRRTRELKLFLNEMLKGITLEPQ